MGNKNNKQKISTPPTLQQKTIAMCKYSPKLFQYFQIVPGKQLLSPFDHKVIMIHGYNASQDQKKQHHKIMDHYFHFFRNGQEQCTTLILMNKAFFTSDRKLSNILFMDQYVARIKKLKKIQYDVDRNAIKSVGSYFSFNSKSLFQVYQKYLFINIDLKNLSSQQKTNTRLNKSHRVYDDQFNETKTQIKNKIQEKSRYDQNKIQQHKLQLQQKQIQVRLFLARISQIYQIMPDYAFIIGGNLHAITDIKCQQKTKLTSFNFNNAGKPRKIIWQNKFTQIQDSDIRTQCLISNLKPSKTQILQIVSSDGHPISNKIVSVSYCKPTI